MRKLGLLIPSFVTILAALPAYSQKPSVGELRQTEAVGQDWHWHLGLKSGFGNFSVYVPPAESQLNLEQTDTLVQHSGIPVQLGFGMSYDSQHWILQSQLSGTQLAGLTADPNSSGAVYRRYSGDVSLGYRFGWPWRPFLGASAEWRQSEFGDSGSRHQIAAMLGGLRLGIHPTHRLGLQMDYAASLNSDLQFDSDSAHGDLIGAQSQLRALKGEMNYAVGRSSEISFGFDYEQLLASFPGTRPYSGLGLTVHRPSSSPKTVELTSLQTMLGLRRRW